MEFGDFGRLELELPSPNSRCQSKWEQRLPPAKELVGVDCPLQNPTTEEGSLPLVLNDLPPVHEVIVVDNNSNDRTARVARENGARVVREERQGYGSACLKGINELDDPDIVVFVDADYSDFPEEMIKVNKVTVVIIFFIVFIVPGLLPNGLI